VSIFAILGLNAFLVRELFTTTHLAYMNSMHGAWMAMARLAGDRWWFGGWWPYWGGGMPFEYTYSPLVPGVTALLAWATGLEIPRVFYLLTGAVLCLAPVTAFLLCREISGRVAPGLMAAMAMTLLSPSSLLFPDSGRSWAALADARLLYLVAVWDELPHFLAVALLPLAILLVHRGRRAGAALVIALMMLASAFGATVLVVAAICLEWRHLRTAAFAGAAGYLIASPYLSPSLLRLIGRTQAAESAGWTIESLYGALVVVAGAVLLRVVLRKVDFGLRFAAILAWITTALVALHAAPGWHVLPQAGRYRVEVELAWAMLAGFGLWAIGRRLPRRAQWAAAGLLAAMVLPLAMRHRTFARGLLRGRPEVSSTIEWQTAQWLARELPGRRVFLPGSMAQWLNAFGENPQFAGGSWSTRMNEVQERALYVVQIDGSAQASLDWLKAYGADAVAVTGPGSREFWKPFPRPDKFEGVLPVLWTEPGTTIYRVPRRNSSLAHVLPAAAGDLRSIVAALDDPALPPAQFEWRGRDRAVLNARLSAGQAILVQISHHAGWRSPEPLKRDALGQIRLEPRCTGGCEVELRYDGGWELRMCRVVSLVALAGVGVLGGRRWGQRK
ncbi:MAG: hypothetical protein ACRD44_01315, partial [Bryobacteraceae bacterium]